MLTDMIRSSPDQWAYIQQYVSCQVQRCKNKRKESLAIDSGVGLEEGKAGGEGGGEGGETGSADPLPDGCDGEEETWSNLEWVEQKYYCVPSLYWHGGSDCECGQGKYYW